MASVVLSGDTSGSITIAAPAVSGSTTQTLVNVTGTLAPIVSGTAVASTSGTSIDFTSIPSWVKRVTVMFNGFSTNGSSNYLVQLGDAGGIEATGYLGAGAYISAAAVASTAFTTGFGIQNGAGGAAAITHGAMIISLQNSATNTWTAIGNFCNSDTPRTLYMAGIKPLSDVLTQVRITTVNGTDTFDAGSINILYE